jgi:hypothetical protein
MFKVERNKILVSIFKEKVRWLLFMDSLYLIIKKYSLSDYTNQPSTIISIKLASAERTKTN